MKRLLFTILAITCSLYGLLSQEFSSYPTTPVDTSVNYGYFHFIRFDVHRGANVTGSGNEDVLKAFQESGYTGFDLRLGWQTTGLHQWHQLHKYPTYGFGFSSFLFDTRDVENLIGNPSGVYVWAGLPFFWNKKRTFHFDMDMAFGLTYDLNAYDPITNPYNDAVGSKILFYFNFAPTATMRLSERYDLLFGANLIHFSNGRTRTPNLGVNLLGFNLGAAYNFNAITNITKYKQPDYQPPIRPEFLERDLPRPYLDKGYNIWTVYAAAGWNTTTRDPELNDGDVRGPSYLASTVAFEYARRHWPLGAYTVGLNYHFDASLGEKYPAGDDPSVWDRSTVGIALGYEYFIERFSIIAQLGLHPFQTDIKDSARGRMYIRGGFRARITPNLFGYMALKTQNGAIADYVEWGVGYSFFDKNKAMPIYPLK